MLRLKSAAVCTAEDLCVFEKKFSDETALKISDFQSFLFPHQFCAEKKCHEEPLPYSDNPTTASKNKVQKVLKYPFGMLYNAIDDLEDKLLRKLRNRARLMKTKRKKACIGG